MPSGDLHEVVAARLRKSTHRYTRGRRALVDVLASSPKPMTIHEILHADRSLAQSSAYRNLAVLEQATVVHRIVTSDEFARFELEQDFTEHHHHLICERCGEVADFTLPERLESELDTVLEKTATDQRFSGVHHRLDLVGTCRSCG